MIPYERTYDGRKVIIETMTGTAFTGESGAHQFRISAETGSFTGTITAYMIRADGTTCTVAGETDGGVAVVTLNQDCYNVPGRFMLSIFETVDESSSTCIYACMGNVARTTTGAIVDSGDIVPDLQNITAAYQAAVAAVAGLDVITGHNLVASIPKVSGRIIRYDNGNKTSQSGCSYKIVSVTGISTLVYTRTKASVSTSKVGMAFYDSNGDFIPGSGQQTYIADTSDGFVMTAIDVPEGAATAGFTWRNALETAGYALCVYDKADYDLTLAGRVFNLEQAAQPVGLMSAVPNTDSE